MANMKERTPKKCFPFLLCLTEERTAPTKSTIGTAITVSADTPEIMVATMPSGKNNTPKGLTIKPFQSTDISTVTTTQMWRWTVVLALIPAVSVTVAAILILVRRRNA